MNLHLYQTVSINDGRGNFGQIAYPKHLKNTFDTTRTNLVQLQTPLTKSIISLTIKGNSVGFGCSHVHSGEGDLC